MPRLPLTLAVTALSLLGFGLAPLQRILVIDLTEPLRMFPWQLIGCHLMHWSAEHLLWDLGMFCLLSVICERRWPRRYYVTMALSAILIPLGVMIFQPEIVTYRGLSGIDTGLFALLATCLLRDSVRGKDWPQVILFGGLIASLVGKLGFEFLTGEILFVSDVNFVPLPLAHLIGAVVGLVVALAGRLEAG